MSLPLHLHPEVAAALAEKRAVVAMESTLITHGLPHPQNIEAAMEMETAVREAGAVPATVAIIQGIIHIGLSAGELDYIGTRPAGAVNRCSRRNLPLVLARREDGATTVAGTMIAAYLAGIEMFATGAIGGVHRNHPFDVSTDLTELGRTPVTVVCSGVKPFLDLSATREVLETQGVLVIGSGTDDLVPLFTQHSGHHIDVQLDQANDIAAVIQARQTLGLQSGTLITVPVPKVHRFDDKIISEAIDKAVRDLDEQGVQGPAVTSWMVRNLAQAIGPEAMRANMMLLCHNATLAAQVGIALMEARPLPAEST